MAIQSHQNYYTLMLLLSHIDTTKNQPTIPQLLLLFTEFKNKVFNDEVAMREFISEKIPGCIIPPISYREPLLNSQELSQKVTEINLLINDLCRISNDGEVILTLKAQLLDQLASLVNEMRSAFSGVTQSLTLFFRIKNLCGKINQCNTFSGDFKNEMVKFQELMDQATFMSFDKNKMDFAALSCVISKELDAANVSNDNAGIAFPISFKLTPNSDRNLAEQFSEIVLSDQFKRLDDNAKKQIFKKVESLLRQTFASSIAGEITVYPELILLQHLCPQFDVRNSESLLNFSMQMKYFGNLCGVLKKLIKQKFKLDFLISPAAKQYSTLELYCILEVIEKTNYQHPPVRLLRAIFPEQPANIDRSTADKIIFIILQKLPLQLTSRLIEVVTANKFISIDELKTFCELSQSPIANDNPVVITLGLAELKNKKTASAPLNLSKRVSLILLSDENLKVISKIILTALSDDNSEQLEDLQKLLDKAESIGDIQKRQQFLKVMAYGVLRYDYNVNNPEMRNIFSSVLNDVPNNLSFEAIQKLYLSIPFPRLQYLREFLTNSSLIETYQQYPTGKENFYKTLKENYNLGSVANRIDCIEDISRDTSGKAHRLFKNDREKLYEGIGYVYAVLTDKPLVIPGLNKDDLRKPASKLTNDEIKALVIHYCEQLNNFVYTAEHKWLCQLELLAILTIALYRTHPEHKIPRDTQLVSVLNMMMHGGNVFSEISTGEGKSITTALMAACQWARGGAVDVLTSNMDLAKRDLAEFNDFYAYVGIQTTVVEKDTPFEQYKINGINFSEISEISLWHEKQLLEGKKLPDKVSVVLDEVDFALLQNKTEFRYSASLEGGDNFDNPDEIFYLPILEFVRKKIIFQEKKTTTKEDINALRTYVDSLTILTLDQKKHFLKFPPDLLARWIQSAYMATQLREDIDYTIRTGVIKKYGQEIDVAQAKVKINHAVSEGSHYSEGVHQFLHVILNERMKHDEDLQRKCCNLSFPIEREKFYLASRTSKNTAQFYSDRQGNIIGLSGTMGTNDERQELVKHYGAHVFKIPTHQLAKRDSKPPIIATTRFGETPENAHFRRVLVCIQEAQKKNQPVLVLCKDSIEAKKLHAKLKKFIKVNELDIFTGDDTSKNFHAAVRKAAESRMVTISTPILGRGANITPKEGLHVATTYIPMASEQRQGEGRAARNGMYGSDQMVLSTQEFTARGYSIPSNAKAAQTTISAIQSNLENELTNDRYQRQLFADLRNQFQLEYIAFCKDLPNSDKKLKNKIWTTFLTEMESKWAIELNKIKQAVQDHQTKLKAEIEATYNGILQGADKKKKLADVPNAVTLFERNQLQEKIKTFKDATVHLYNKHFSGHHRINSHQILATLQDKPSQPIPTSSNINLAADLSVPTNPNETQALVSYVRLANDKATEEQKNELLQHLLIDLNKKVNKLQLPDAQVTVKNIAKKLLSEHYQLAKINGPDFAYLQKILNLIRYVSQYGTDADKKALSDALNAQKADVESDVKNIKGVDKENKNIFVSRYLLTLRTFETCFSFTPNNTNKVPLKDLIHFARKRLDIYLNRGEGIWGRRSDDKIVLAVDLQKSLNELSENKNQTDGKKIQSLLNKLSDISKKITEQDKIANKSSLLFSRGASRLQAVVNEITAYALNQQSEILSQRQNIDGMDGDIDSPTHAHIHEMIAAINDRIGLFNNTCFGGLKIDEKFKITVPANINETISPDELKRIQEQLKSLKSFVANKVVYKGFLSLIDNAIIQVNLIERANLTTRRHHLEKPEDISVIQRTLR